jgi:Ca2+-binding EF-hand superfamily protein
MGNQVADSRNRMAVAAMAYVTHLEREELVLLLDACQKFTEENENPTVISRSKFDMALQTVGINQNDADILDRIFTMYDVSNEDIIVYKHFLVGVTPLVKGTHLEVFSLAFEIYDDKKTKTLGINDIIDILNQLNKVSSYFGDPVLTEQQLVTIVQDSLQLNETSDLSQSIFYSDYIEAIANHSLVHRFLAGEGTVHYEGEN